MSLDSSFQAYVEAGLASFGIEADELELAVIAGVNAVYEPALELLRTADLSRVEPEPNVDLSRPPE